MICRPLPAGGSGSDIETREKPRFTRRSGSENGRREEATAKLLWKAFRSARAADASRSAAGRRSASCRRRGREIHCSHDIVNSRCCRWKMRLALRDQPNLPGNDRRTSELAPPLSGRGGMCSIARTYARGFSRSLTGTANDLRPARLCGCSSISGFTFAERGISVPYFVSAWDQSCLFLADHDGTSRIDAWLRRH